MSNLSIIFQILKKSIFKPKLMIELAEEKSEINEDQKHKLHNYVFIFDSIDEFFKDNFSNSDLKNFDYELNELNPQIEQFFDKLEHKKYPSKEKPYPIDYSLNVDSRKFLYYLCRIIKPTNVVETGVAYGLSSLFILAALNKNKHGNLFSIDSKYKIFSKTK